MHCEDSNAACKYDLVISHATDLLSNDMHVSGPGSHGTRLYRFIKNSRYGSSANYGLVTNR